MKTAIILTGHMRSFDRCLPTLHWHVFRHFPGADFFVSTVGDDDAIKVSLLREKYPQARIEIDIAAEQPDCVKEMRGLGVNLPDKWQRGTPYTHEPYAISVHPQAVLRQLWQLEQGWKLLMRTTPLPDYSCVIRCRPDLWFHSLDLSAHSHSDASFCAQNVACVPWWGSFGGVNDRFAIMGAAAAQAYFETYSAIPTLAAEGCPIHPESLVATSLEAGGMFAERLFAEFSTLRNDGTMRGPEISSIDLARLHT